MGDAEPALVDLSRSRRPRYVTAPADAARICWRKLGDQSIERVVMLYLGQDFRLLGQTTYGGQRRSAPLHLAQLLGKAMSLRASGLIMAHNHPSGSLEISDGDRDATSIVADGARLLGLTLVDHLVFAGDRYVGFRERGLL